MRRAIAAAVLAVVAAAGSAQEPVVLRDYQHKVGDRIRYRGTSTIASTVAIEVDGKKDREVQTNTETREYVAEVLEVGPNPARPAKIRRTYGKAVAEEDGVVTKHALDGLTVVIARADGKYTFARPDGTPVPAAAAAELAGSFNPDRDRAGALLPGTRVAPGGTWDATKWVVADFGAAGVGPGAKAAGKLLSASGPDRVVEVTAELPLTAWGTDQPVKLDPGSRAVLAAKLTGRLDGATPDFSSEVKATAEFVATRPGGTFRATTVVKTRTRIERAE